MENELDKILIELKDKILAAERIGLSPLMTIDFAITEAKAAIQTLCDKQSIGAYAEGFNKGLFTKPSVDNKLTLESAPVNKGDKK